MSTKSTRNKQHQRTRSAATSFRLHPVTSVIAGLFLAASGSTYAADPSIADLQAEIARLKQTIAVQAAAAAQNTAPSGTPAATTPDTAKATAPAVEEQQTLGEVTITGTSRIAAVKDVPTSISISTGEDLQKLNAADIGSILKRASNVVWNQGNQRSSSISIRGIGKVGQTEAQDPSIGVTVDGVSYAYNALTSSYDFTDLDTLEVLRGPQGTLGGKNASLGVINITTNRPSFTPSSDYSLTLGQRGTVAATYAGGGPIVDDLLAWRGTFSANKGSGDMVNLADRDQSFTNTDRLAGRVQFLLTPTRDFNARVSVEIQPNSGETSNNRTIYTQTPGVYSNGTVNPLATDAQTRLNRSWFTAEGNYSYLGNYLNGSGQGAVDYNNGLPQVTGSRSASAELNWTLGTHTFTSITAYKDYHFNAVNDEGTPFDINPNSGGFFLNYKQLSQEFRVSSEQGGFFDYQAGAYFLTDRNIADYNKSWGSDAGAYFATTAQYNRLDATAAGQLLMVNSLDRLAMLYNSPAGTQDIRNSSDAIFAQGNLHFSDRFTLTTGGRFTHEVRNISGRSAIIDNGYGASLNPVSVNGVQLGGFNSSAAGTLVAGNSAAQLALADSVALQYFGIKPTGVAGAAYNSLTAAQLQQVADAKNIRATNAGVLFNQSAAQSYSGNLPTLSISPSYKIDDNLTTYASLQYGVKAGISQFTNGVSNPVKAERTTSYEWGIKSALLDKTLIINGDLYWTNIANYQQAVRVLDVYTTALNVAGGNNTYAYTTATGNVAKVISRGLELDATYNGFKNTVVRVAGAYNNAFYKSFTNSAQPVENGYVGAAPYQDVSGQTLPGAAKVTLNLAVDYHVPVWTDKEFHTSFNTAFTSRYNSDTALSSYAWIGGNSITDIAVGLGNAKKTFDVSLLVKNLFNNNAPLAQTWNTYTPANPRWIGIVFRGKQ